MRNLRLTYPLARRMCQPSIEHRTMTHLNHASSRSLTSIAMSLMLSSMLSLSVMFSQLQPSSAEVIDRIVALVNDSVITLSELQELTLPLEMRLQSVPNPLQRAQLLREQTQLALEQLIGQRLLLQVAQEQGVTVKDEQVEAHLQGIMKQQGWGESEFNQYLKAQGMTRDAVKAQSRDLLVQQTVTQRNLANKLSISEIELKDEYRIFLSEAKARTQVEGAHLFLQVAPGSSPAEEASIKQRTQELLVRARSGEQFASLVREFGEGSSASRGGDLGVISRGGGLPRELEEAFLGMKEGDLAGPIRSPFGYHILRATRVIAAQLPALNEVKPQLEMRLRQQKYQEALKVWIEELKSSAFIERRL